MLFILMKNNLKLMLRSHWIIMLMIVSPIVITAVLNNVFEQLMKSYESPENILVGYRMDENSLLADFMPNIKTTAAEHGISMVELSGSDVQELVKNNGCMVFVEMGNEDYVIYEIDDYENEGRIVEYFLTGLFDSIAVQNTTNSPKLDVIQLDVMPNVEAKDYYGIVYTVFVIWCCFVVLTGVISSERSNKIEQKYQVTLITDWKLYLGKAIPCVFVTLIVTGITTLASTCLFDIRWGSLPASILILFLSIAAATVYGLFCCCMFRTLAISISISFVSIWIAGFIGGAFETYMYSSIRTPIKEMSPLYHINRALVECSAIGSSTYVKSSILYLGGIIIVFTVLGLALSKWKRGPRL